jgi:hypothetical protein
MLEEKGVFRRVVMYTMLVLFIPGNSQDFNLRFDFDTA